VYGKLRLLWAEGLELKRVKGLTKQEIMVLSI